MMSGRAEPVGSQSAAYASLPEVAERVLQDLPAAILVFDRSLCVVHRNKAAGQLFGPVNTAAQLPVSGRIESAHPDWEAVIRQVLDSGVPVRHDSVLFEPPGDTERLLNVLCTPLTDDNGNEPAGVILVAVDMTDRASLERRLAVSERLAGVGKLASRVAHELNNPLDGILRYINLSIRLLDADAHGKVVSYLTESRKGLMRMAQILGELLEFSRTSPTHLDESDINRTVEEAIRTMQQQADAAGVVIAVVFHQEHMPSVRGGMLYQICCNLVKNAIDAMPDGGRLTVTTSVTDKEVILRFEDTGEGLPEPIEQIFKPFFTTKKPGKGTGLGLAICKDYVERLHGKIAARNAASGGATITVYIPVSSCVPNPARKSRHE